MLIEVLKMSSTSLEYFQTFNHTDKETKSRCAVYSKILFSRDSGIFGNVSRISTKARATLRIGSFDHVKLDYVAPINRIHRNFSCQSSLN